MIKCVENLVGVVDTAYLKDRCNVFFSEGLLKHYSKEGNRIIFLYSEKFIIPVLICRRALFHYAHLCVEPGVIKDGEESLKSFLNDVCSYLQKVEKVQWINQNSAASFFMDYPSSSKHIPFGSHVIDLSLSEDELWKNVHSKHRNVIKKAEKDGIIIESGRSQELLNDFYSIDKDTWERSQKSSNGIDYYKSWMEDLKENAIVYIAYLDGIPQSGAIYFYNRQMCYYMYGANKNSPHIGSGNYLQWRAILDMKTNGIKKFSFVGCRINEDENSKYHGIQRFKERFGGELVQGYLFKIDFKPMMRNLFNLLVSIRDFLNTHQWSFYQDVIDQEIHKWPQE